MQAGGLYFKSPSWFSLMPRITTITPCYQAEKTIRATLESLQKQTFKDWECIVIDDGSTDSSAEIVEAFAKQDSRIRLLRQENAGPSVARNTGLKEAVGTYIHFLDADDLIVPEAYQKFLAGFQQNRHADIVYCNWNLISESDVIGGHVQSPEQYLFQDVASKNYFPPQVACLKKELLNEIGFFDEDLMTVEDWDLWLRASRLGKIFHHISDSLVSYRRMQGTLSRNSRQMLEDTRTVLQRLRTLDPRLNSEKQQTITDEEWRQNACRQISYYLGRAIRQQDEALFKQCKQYLIEVWSTKKEEPSWNVASLVLGMNESELADSALKQLADYREFILRKWNWILEVDNDTSCDALSKSILENLFQQAEALTEENRVLNLTLWNRCMHAMKRLFGYRS